MAKKSFMGFEVEIPEFGKKKAAIISLVVNGQQKEVFVTPEVLQQLTDKGHPFTKVRDTEVFHITYEEQTYMTELVSLITRL